MIANRELGMDDYLAIGRRRILVVVVPVLLAPLLGFLISYALTPKYTSRSLLLVEGQVVPAGYVKPIVTERVSARMITLQQNALSRNRLEPMVTRLGLAKNGKSVDSVIDEIRENLTIAETDLSPGSKPGRASTTINKAPGGTADVPAFYVNYTTNNARDAQQVCAEITSMLLEENLELRKQVAQSTTDFLERQLEQAKHDLDEQDAKLASFRNQHIGRLPSDLDSNSKILTGLQSQLEANIQGLNRMQQDKSYAEMQLNQNLAAWKSSLAVPNYPSLRQQLIQLQNKLVTMQSLYTEDYPDVVKVEHEIAKVKAKLKDLNADADTIETKGDGSNADNLPTTPDGRRVRLEPAEIVSLREQIRRHDLAIEHATAQQKQLQERINMYQDRLNVSPEIEEEYKQLTRDNVTAHDLYNNLLTNKNNAVIQSEMERNQEGEQLKLLDPASLPGSASFPVRWMFAAYGLAAGLCLGVCFAAWLELRDKSIRDEGDVLAALELPMLGALPWSKEEPEDVKGLHTVRRPLTLLLEEKKNA